MQRQIAAYGLALLAAAFTPPAAIAKQAAPPPACRTISKPQVAALVERWGKALQTKRPEVVVAEYAADATLLPTVENGPLVGPEAIGQYFVSFLKKSPQATIETSVIHTGCNTANDIGLYSFMVDGDQPGSRKQVKARYTFIYAPVHGKWLIVHHHSSAFPVAAP